MAEEARRQSIQPERREALQELSWEEINEPGAYVERGTGDLFRIPKEALQRGSSPLIYKESRGASRLVKISADPFVTNVKARMTCAQHNIEPNF